MKILLLGEFSNVHATLALGLRKLGHDVVVASDGDEWKNYPRDIDLHRPSLKKWDSLRYFLRLNRQFKDFKGFDIVQLINPIFVPLKAERNQSFFHFLRKHNRKIVLGAFGMDSYYIKGCLDEKTFRYSDFAIGKNQRYSVENQRFIQDWILGEKFKLHEFVVQNSDAVVAGLMEYYAAYQAHFQQKERLHFIPFPIQISEETKQETQRGKKLRFFVGIQRSRAVYKGVDVLLPVLKEVQKTHPDLCEIDCVENLPFEEYKRRLSGADVIVDQLYSYTPAMNALEAMSQGIVPISGGEPESYELLNENQLRPIINAIPGKENELFQTLCHLVTHADEELPKLKQQCRDYIRKHHDYEKIASAYEQLYLSLLSEESTLCSPKP